MLCTREIDMFFLDLPFQKIPSSRIPWLYPKVLVRDVSVCNGPLIGNLGQEVLGKIMFYTCVTPVYQSFCSQGEGCYDVTPCYGQHHHPLDSTTPWTAPPPDSTAPPIQQHPPSRSKSGWYASYWNAFLLRYFFTQNGFSVNAHNNFIHGSYRELYLKVAQLID